MLKVSKQIASLPDWQQKFDRPIPVQNQRQLFRLRDAATFITELPPAEQKTEQWQLAAKLLMQVAEHGGDLAPTRRAVLRALHYRELQASSKRRARIVRIIR